MTPGSGPVDEDVPSRLTAVAVRLDQALVSGDVDAAAACFTEDAVLGESGAPDAVGRAAIRAFLVRGNEVRAVIEHRMFRDDLVLMEQRAIEFARFNEVKVPAGGEPVRERGRVVIDWRRAPDGSWRIGRLVVSDLPAE